MKLNRRTERDYQEAFEYLESIVNDDWETKEPGMFNTATSDEILDYLCGIIESNIEQSDV